MILRRVIAHLRKQDWTAVGLDFVIVVLGVFVGIQASNLNSARIDRTLEKEYVDRIVIDLGSIIAAAEFQRRFEQNKSKQVIAALATTWQQPSDAKRLRLGHLLTAMTVRLSPNFESSTFNDLQNSGHLSLIRHARMRTQLSTYFARLQYLRSVIGRNNDNYVETYVNFLRNEGIGAGFADPSAVPDVALAETEANISTLTRARFGTLDITAHSSSLARPPSDPSWEKLRGNLTWRGYGAAVNENLLNMIITDASAMRKEVERQQAADRN
jgi:hypothetical protein